MADPIQAVLFDIDGTICEYRRDSDELLSVAFDRLGLEPFFSATEYERRFDDFTEVADTIDELRSMCFAAIAEDCGRDPDVGRALASEYAAERDHANVCFLDGARNALEQLAAYRPLAAVTNGSPEMQQPKLDALELDCFEVVVHAGYETPSKPNPEPFHIALEAINATPERSLYVGNSLEADILGAHNAGLQSAWIANGNDSSPEPTPDFILDSPGEILDVPGILYMK